MGEAALKNWATHYGNGVTILDAGGEPANDTTQLVIPRFKWIHCANEGMYEGHHQGPFNLTRQVFESFVKNLRDHPQYRAGSLQLSDGQTYTGGIAPVIQFDYEHASECPPWEGNIPAGGAPACGWCLDVDIRNQPDGKAQFWAFGDLGDELREQIRLRKQRWVSIAFALESVHWITKAPLGPMLTSIAITNHPFMRDLEPLAAANRPTSQAGRSAVRSASSPSEAPDRNREPTRTGATMDEKQLRDRICRALKINLAADDAAVGAAVEEAVAGNGSLKSLLEALGVPKVDDALKAIPELRAAREKIAGLLGELDALMAQEAAVDAGVAKVDVGAAMSAAKLSGSGAEDALVAYRNVLVNQEISKIAATKKHGEHVMLSERRSAVELGRKAFLSKYGVSNLDNSHLSTTLVSGAGGTQVEAPKAGGAPLTIEQRNAGDAETIDLRGVPGPNPTARLLTHLKKTQPGFDKLPIDRQLGRAIEIKKTAQLQLE